MSLEKDFYSPLDNDSNLIANKIIESARRSKSPQLSPNEKATWDLFFFHQWQRTPDGHSYLQRNFDFKLVRSSFESKLIAAGRPLTESEKEFIDNLEQNKQFYENARIKSLKAPPGKSVLAMGSKGLGIVRSANINKSFIVGSFPVVKLTYSGRTILSDPTVEVWLPIAHDVAVSPWGNSGQEFLNTINGDEIRSLNEHICTQSTEIAAPSAELLRSLLNAR